MTLFKNFMLVAVGAAIGLTAFAFFYTARANPSYFIVGTASGAATTTLNYLNAGTGTTTVYQAAYNTSNNYAVNAASLLLQFTASSTNSSINVNFEYADITSGVDCTATPGLCDWYQDATYPEATSTVNASNIFITGVRTYKWTFASTTPGLGVVPTSTTRDTRLITVKTPAPYIRAIITASSGSTNAAVWAKFLPIKEVHE